jgi:hypothetical protein
MKARVLAMLVASGIVAAATSAGADGRGNDDKFEDKITVAVFGDWPYNQLLLDNADLLTGSINGEPDVRAVIHVGDIHSGSMACTSAGILPPIPTSNPGWNQKVYSQFQQFNAPVVYTPGDNEWTDCQKTKEFKSGAPLKELASVRSLFFARPGHTLGLEDMEVLTQAQHFDPKFPADAQFVENVMWQAGKVVFLTLNMPGSNNDTLPWANGFDDPAGQSAEVKARTDANIRWMQAAFAQASRTYARAVVIALQADMWDRAALPPGGDGLDAYTPFVTALANAALGFGRPVLLLNGDSHLFEADHPLLDPASLAIHRTRPVPNLTRITVQGSTNAPAEWLRLTIDTRKSNPFSWTNIPYCADPTTHCE